MKNLCNVNDRNPGESGLRSFFYVLLLGLLLAVAGLVWYGNQLIISVIPEDNLQIYRFPTKVGDEWHYLYIHSVQQTPCEEFFTIKGSNHMLMTYTRFQSYGVGLPCYTDDGKFKQTDDGHFILEMNRPYKNVAFRTQDIPKPRLYINGEEIPIYKLYPSGTLVTVTVDKRYKMWLD